MVIITLLRNLYGYDRRTIMFQVPGSIHNVKTGARTILNTLPDFTPEFDPAFQFLVQTHLKCSGSDLQTFFAGIGEPGTEVALRP